MGTSKSKQSSSPGKGGKVTLQLPPSGPKQGATQKTEQARQTKSPHKTDGSETAIPPTNSSTMQSGQIDERIVSQSEDGSSTVHQENSIDRTNDSETQRRANSSAYQAGFGRIGTMIDHSLLDQSSEHEITDRTNNSGDTQYSFDLNVSERVRRYEEKPIDLDDSPFSEIVRLVNKAFVEMGSSQPIMDFQTQGELKRIIDGYQLADGFVHQAN
jgi:hypothetical protein